MIRFGQCWVVVGTPNALAIEWAWLLARAAMAGGLSPHRPKNAALLAGARKVHVAQLAPRRSRPAQGRKVERYCDGVRPVSSRNAALNADREV